MASSSTVLAGGAEADQARVWPRSWECRNWSEQSEKLVKERSISVLSAKSQGWPCQLLGEKGLILS